MLHHFLRVLLILATIQLGDGFVHNHANGTKEVVNVAMLLPVLSTEEHLQDMHLPLGRLSVEPLPDHYTNTFDLSWNRPSESDIFLHHKYTRCVGIDKIGELSTVNRTMSKYEKVFFDTKDLNPMRLLLNLERNERFRLDFSQIGPWGCRCYPGDKVVTYMKERKTVNGTTRVRVEFHYKTLDRKYVDRFKNSIIAEGSVEILIPNTCFRVGVISLSLERYELDWVLIYFRHAILFLIVTGACSMIYINFKYAAECAQLERLERACKRARKYDNLRRHYEDWKNSI